MKYIFDFMELEISEGKTVIVHRNGRDSGLKYSASARKKNFIERITCSDEVRDIPNIVLRRRLRGMKLIFTKAEAGQYRFTLVSWFIPFGVQTKSMYYASKLVVGSFIRSVETNNA